MPVPAFGNAQPRGLNDLLRGIIGIPEFEYSFPKMLPVPFRNFQTQGLAKKSLTGTKPQGMSYASVNGVVALHGLEHFRIRRFRWMGNPGFKQYRVPLTEAGEIEGVSSSYSFAGVHNLELPTTLLDSIPKKEIIDSLSGVINKVKPEIIYIPNRLDAHSDHQIIHDCSIACTKPFRYPFIKTVRVYQTLSETGFNLRLESLGFKPNLLIDISNYLDKKIDIMNQHLMPRA